MPRRAGREVPKQSGGIRDRTIAAAGARVFARGTPRSQPRHNARVGRRTGSLRFVTNAREPASTFPVCIPRLHVARRVLMSTGHRSRNPLTAQPWLLSTEAFEKYADAANRDLTPAGAGRGAARVRRGRPDERGLSRSTRLSLHRDPRPRHPRIGLHGTLAILATAALGPALLPGIRAGRVDPAVAMRQE
jgi:hypothetical protein